jgi:hypothetical protein
MVSYKPVLGIPDPDILGIPDPDPSLFLIKVFRGLK